MANFAGETVTTNELKHRVAELEVERARLEHDLVGNVSTLRNDFFRQMMDPRRNLNKECGYPTSLTAWDYQLLYDRNPYAARVVEVMPKESWQTHPTVYEKEKGEETAFETAWDGLSKQVQQTKSWYADTEGSIIGEILLRADIQCGIGQYGVILLGLNDGLDMSLPVDGVEEKNSMPGLVSSAGMDGSAGAASSPNGPNGDLGQNLTKNVCTDTQFKLMYGSTTPVVNWKDPYRGALKTIPFGDDGSVPTVNANQEYSLSLSPGKKGGRVAPSLVANEADSDGDEPQVTFKPGKRQLTYLRVLPESQAMVTRWEMNRTSPRFGQPVSYLCTINSAWDTNTSQLASSPQVSLNVHWTRVVHVVDNRQSSPVIGRPRMQPVLNRLLDLDKIFGAAGEGYWKGCFTGLSVESHPQLGGQVKSNKRELRDALENYDNSLQRSLILMGMSAKTLAPVVTDPTPHVKANEGAICVQLAMPVRIFQGSERGELASSEDDGKWNDVLRTNQRTHCTPDVIVPFVDRLILVGVLPEPEEYHVDWPDLESQTDQEKATYALTMAQALAAYLPVKDMCVEEDFLIEFAKLDEKTAKRIVRKAAKQVESDMDDDAALAQQHGMIPAPPDGFQHKEPVTPPAPVKIKPGEKLVTPKMPTEPKPPAPE